MKDLENQLDESLTYSIRPHKTKGQPELYGYPFDNSNSAAKEIKAHHDLGRNVTVEIYHKNKLLSKKDINPGDHIKNSLKKMNQNVSECINNLENQLEQIIDESSRQSNEQTTSIKTMIESILAGELVESSDKFSDILTNKIAVKLEESRIAVAKSLFGIKESEEEDEKQPETSDEDFHKSLHARLKTAEDMDANPLKDDEKENPNDKRVIAGLKARAAKGEMSKPNAHRDIPLKSGSVTLKDGEAKHINHFLSGLKPDKRKEVLDHMHKSPEHFNKIHDVVKRFPGYSQHSSIYKDERAQ